jgi:hypothetical protein
MESSYKLIGDAKGRGAGFARHPRLRSPFASPRMLRRLLLLASLALISAYIFDAFGGSIEKPIPQPPPPAPPAPKEEEPKEEPKETEKLWLNFPG